MSIEWKPIEPAHTHEWARLSNLLADAEGTGERYGAEDLAEELHEATVNPALDTIGVWDGGQMVAYGQLRIACHARGDGATAFLAGGVHPGWRGLGIGRAVMDWIELRAEELAAVRHGGALGTLSLWAGEPRSGSARIAEARGYRPSRFLHDLRLDLTAWPAARTSIRSRPVEVSALRLPLDPADPVLIEGVRRAHHDAFAEHRGVPTRDPQSWAAQLGAACFRPQLSRAALSPLRDIPLEDAVESYVLCSEHEPGELYVFLVGTRRHARGRGLATVLLKEVLAAAKAAGYRNATLGVEAATESGGLGLYLPLGFENARTGVVYERPMRVRQA
ncbi:GNAT family N-acetyltransferase [Sinomonas sp.]|uniref:GNAT family N-acetyltransferase n=1 Tax=Sinomonas sp. TaxID=1914986 RepID=UPI002FE0AEFB